MEQVRRLKNNIKALEIILITITFLLLIVAVHNIKLQNKIDNLNMKIYEIKGERDLADIRYHGAENRIEVMQKKWDTEAEILKNQIKYLMEQQLETVEDTTEDAEVLVISKAQESPAVETKKSSSSAKINAKDSGFRCFEYSSAITSQSSKQWKIVHEAEVGEYGFLYHTGYPLAAIGHGWGYVIGDIVEVVTDQNRYIIVVGDYKAYKDTDSTNKISYRSGCMCEFIVSKNDLDIRIKKSGNVATLDQYKGYVLDMIKLGNVWED